MWTICFYTSERGEPIVESFILQQDKQTQAKIARLFDLLETHGPQLMMPYARYLGGALYELRVRDRNEVRIFYLCMSQAREVILLHACKKRTQRLPEKELLIARTRQGALTKYNT